MSFFKKKESKNKTEKIPKEDFSWGEILAMIIAMYQALLPYMLLMFASLVLVYFLLILFLR